MNDAEAFQAANRAAINNRLRAAFDQCAKWYAREHQTGADHFVAFVWAAVDQAEQVHHGTTEYALAAWYDWRRSHPDRVRKARGVVDYLIPDMEGDRTIETPAVVLTVGEDELALTGCTWGYGGEGPHGTALVLTDAGFFADLDAALRWVASLEGAAPWELVGRQ